MLSGNTGSSEGPNWNKVSDTMLPCLQEHEKLLASLESNLRLMETFVITKSVEKGKSKLEQLLPDLYGVRETVEQARNQVNGLSVKLKKIIMPPAEKVVPKRKLSDVSRRLEELGMGYLNDEPDLYPVHVASTVSGQPAPGSVKKHIPAYSSADDKESGQVKSLLPKHRDVQALNRHGHFKTGLTKPPAASVTPKITERPVAKSSHRQHDTFFARFPTSFPAEVAGNTKRGKGQDRAVLIL